MKSILSFVFTTLLVLVITSYKNLVPEPPFVSLAQKNAGRNAVEVAPKDTIRTGADQTEKYVLYLKGKRVTILANQTSIIGPRHMLDSLKSLGAHIVKVFGPEHGFRGNASAGAAFVDEKDPAFLSFHYTAKK